jgi:hypothetical protein
LDSSRESRPVAKVTDACPDLDEYDFNDYDFDPAFEDGDEPPAAYPMFPVRDDPKFTVALVLDLGKVLAQHGYPPLEVTDDLNRMFAAMGSFLYGGML